MSAQNGGSMRRQILIAKDCKEQRRGLPSNARQRQHDAGDDAAARVRDGDAVLDVIPGSTIDNVIYFASDGVAYTLPIELIPVSSGYGEPISKHVRMGDGVSLVAALTTDARFTPGDDESDSEMPPAPYFVALTSRGQIMRLPLAPFRSASTKSGRKYCRLAEGDRVVWVELIRDATSIFVATKQARVTHFALFQK